MVRTTRVLDVYVPWYTYTMVHGTLSTIGTMPCGILLLNCAINIEDAGGRHTAGVRPVCVRVVRHVTSC
jgi:hypothetical protein